MSLFGGPSNCPICDRSLVPEQGEGWRLVGGARPTDWFLTHCQKRPSGLPGLEEVEKPTHRIPRHNHNNHPRSLALLCILHLRRSTSRKNGRRALPPHGVSRLPHLAARRGPIRNSQVQRRVASERRLARICYPNI